MGRRIPGAWDHWFGELSSFTAGEGEARARARKAASLPAPLAALYGEVRRLRDSGEGTVERLLALRAEAERFRDDWLLRVEIDELLGSPATAPASVRA